MSQSVSAFYLPKPKKHKKSLFNSVAKSLLSANILRIINSNNLNLSNFNSVNFAQNFLSCCNSTKNMKYSFSVLSNILSGKPVRSSTLLNLFFSGFSLVLSNKLLKFGYSDMNALIADIKSGNLCVSAQNFLQEFSDALAFANKSLGADMASRYGDELPIDVVENCGFLYQDSIALHKISSPDELVNWVSDMAPVTMNLEVCINNSSGQFSDIDSYIQRLCECMLNKLRITVRLGKNIYQNCIIESLNPNVSNVYMFKLFVKLRFNYYSGLYNVNSGNNIILNPTPVTLIEKMLTKPYNAGTFI